MFNEGTPDGYLMNFELQMVSHPAGRAMKTLPFDPHDPEFVMKGELVVVAVPMVSESIWTVLKKTLSIPP